MAIRQVLVEENALADAAAFHARMQDELGFPAYYGRNLSALADCLGDIDAPTRLALVPSQPDAGAPDASAAWFSKAAGVARRVARENPNLEVVTDEAARALAQLVRGNEAFLGASHPAGDVSPALRERLAQQGQHPYVCVIACSDSRISPEAAFSCGLGEVFCVRTAGNVVGTSELASVVYACEHLGVRLVVVLGHTGCGAVEAAMGEHRDEALAVITEPLAAAINGERDPQAASVRNVHAGVSRLRTDLALQPLLDEGSLSVIGALYHTATGAVEFV